MRRPVVMALALALLSLLLPLSVPTAWPVSVSSPSLFLRATAAPSAPAVAGSINAIFLELFRQSLLAYQLQVPSFSGVTLSSNSGEGGRAAAASGNFDWTVATNSVPDTMRVTHPTLESYPIASVGVAPSYNLHAETVGAATLTLHIEVMCRMWRGTLRTGQRTWAVGVDHNGAQLHEGQQALTVGFGAVFFVAVVASVLRAGTTAPSSRPTRR